MYYFILFTFIFGCSQEKQITDFTEEGIFDEILGTGQVVKTDSIIKFHFQYELAHPESKVLQTTFRNMEKPASCTYGNPQNQPALKDLEKKMLGMKEGGKRIYAVPKGDKIYKITLAVLEVNEPVKPWDIDNSKAQMTSSGLKYIILDKGDGAPIKNGERIKVDYSGFLTNYKKFDSSVDKGYPIEFNIGQRQVIRGWDEGIMLVNHGGKLRLIIPPELGYGNQGNPVIPANSTLIFDVHVY